MNASPGDRQHLLRMEGILAGLLRYGALVASGWIALGMALGVFNNMFAHTKELVTISDRCLAIGIILLIALPVLRVALMTVVFLLEKDYRFAAISGAVLIIITLGFLLGTLNSHINLSHLARTRPYVSQLSGLSHLPRSMSRPSIRTTASRFGL